jgi:hypothetical protein
VGLTLALAHPLYYDRLVQLASTIKFIHQWVRWRMAGDGVAVVGEVVGVGGFGFREEKDGGGAGGCCTAEGEEWGKRGKNDLKKCSRWPKTEYVRTYKSTFDRTRAGAWVCVCVIRSNLCKQVRTHACSAVRV